MTTLLEQGIIALKQGDKLKARHYFEQVLQADDKNERAWLWLSETGQSLAEQIDCVERVLAINPHNATAQRALEALKQRQAVEVAQPAPSRGLLKQAPAPRPATERKPFRLQPEGAPAVTGRVAPRAKRAERAPHPQGDSLPLVPALIFGTLSVTAVGGLLMLVAFLFLT